MKRYFLVALALIGFACLFSAGVGPSPKAQAVNVFSQCSDSNDSNCADCKSLAQNTATCTDVNSQAKAGGNPIISTLKTVLNTISLIAGIAAIVMIIVAGLRYVLSNGDASGIKAARDSLIYAIVGIIVVLMAQSIVAFALNKIK